MKTYSVAIVEDHVLLSQAIGGLVDSFDRFKVSYLCKNGKELITRLEENSNAPDIVLMDINMPIMNGIETTTWITEHFPNIDVIGLSIEEDERTIIQMLRAGAKGYLMKDVEKSVLEMALNEVITNGFYHSKHVTNILIGSLNGKGNSGAKLKENEISFMKLVCTEMTYKQIADQMCLSPKTIDGYRDALFEKLHVKNRIGLVIYAIKNKIYLP
ncbi:response regulator transcription factor [Kordia sp. YSTF-M3]|uniref:Response regulator transcription factor n=1 Tax=Kordia aestuariivivens TaxID=2759037 RepID=A0ABR7QD59_9FLAO|nr:response regulator transcription factor [Kordia aestuariivivens]MBC8756338.1 response regulator transcription factor [Kordia aestuariivivens]